MFTYEYPRPMFTTDCVVFSIQNSDVEILLIERGHEPFKGFWAFPGGFLDMDETAAACAARELQEEAGIVAENLQWGCLADMPERDPRGRVLSAVYFTFINEETRLQAKAGDDAARYGWHSVTAIPALAADHEKLLQQTIKSAVSYLLHENYAQTFPFVSTQKAKVFLDLMQK